MTGAEVVEAALAALQIAGDAILLAQGVESVVAAGDQLVGIGLVAHVPDDPVAIQIQGLIESQGELHHSETGAEVAAAGGDHFQMPFADLAGDRFELADAEALPAM